MMKWIGVSTNIAISLKMCLQDLSISERSPRDMTNSNEILKALSLWLAPFYGYLCEMATAPRLLNRKKLGLVDLFVIGNQFKNLFKL